MPWPIADAWNQHLDEMNSRRAQAPAEVSLVRLEGPVEASWLHTEHVHPYWQLEVAGHGGFSVSFGKRKLLPKAGDILLIPPENWHYFVHKRGKHGWTVKFAAPELEGGYSAGFLPKGHATRILGKALWEAAELFAEKPDEQLKSLLESLLSAALELFLSGRRGSPEGNALLREVRRLVEEANLACKPIAVAEIAAKRGCSSVYLNRVFKRRLGIPVKVFIDQSRFETARKLLLGSGLSVGEIAGEMGFPDLFGFSRFFKRLSGLSPAAFRKRQAEGGEALRGKRAGAAAKKTLRP